MGTSNFPFGTSRQLYGAPNSIWDARGTFQTTGRNSNGCLRRKQGNSITFPLCNETISPIGRRSRARFCRAEPSLMRARAAKFSESFIDAVPADRRRVEREDGAAQLPSDNDQVARDRLSEPEPIVALRRCTKRAAPSRCAVMGFAAAQPIPQSALSLQMRYHGEPFDLLALIGAQERIVVPERHAAVGIAPRTEHVSMGEQSGAA